jgi:hypothetical protein
MRTCVCGNQVARNAKACPQCGHRFTSSMVKALAWFFGVCIFFGILVSISSNGNNSQPSSPTEKAASSAAPPSPVEDLRFHLAVLGAKQLKDSMRNPDSFKLNDVLIMKNNAVCYVYRGQNGFGGMDVGHAVLTPDGKFRTDESTGFVSLWNKECGSKKTGVNKTWEVGYAAGFHGVLSDK